MSVFPSMGKRETCRIGEAGRGSVYYFADQCKRLQRARSDSFLQEQRFHIGYIGFMCQDEGGSEPFEVYVFGFYFVMVGQDDGYFTH